MLSAFQILPAFPAQSLTCSAIMPLNDAMFGSCLPLRKRRDQTKRARKKRTLDSHQGVGVSLLDVCTGERVSAQSGARRGRLCLQISALGLTSVAVSRLPSFKNATPGIASGTLMIAEPQSAQKYRSTALPLLALVSLKILGWFCIARHLDERLAGLVAEEAYLGELDQVRFGLGVV